jgi:hypothetical protein
MIQWFKTSWPVLLAVALGFWFLGTRSGSHEIPIPRIVTQYDTVKVIDTLWVTKLKHDTVYKVNIVERVVHTPPETVTVMPKLSGVKDVWIAPKRGDSSLVYGFSVMPLDSAGRHYAFTQWQYQYWTKGPLRSLNLVNGTPAMTFDDPPPSCDLNCKAHVAGGAIVVFEILRSAFGHP